VPLKKWWKKKTVIKKSMWVGGIVSLIISFIGGFLIMVVTSIIEGRLVCPTFGGDVGCGNIIGFLLFTLVYMFWLLIFTFVPLIIVGLFIGFIISKTKK